MDREELPQRGGALRSRHHCLRALLLPLRVARSHHRRRACRIGSVAVTLGALALPLVLMWGRRTEGWALSYCVLVTLSLAAALLTVWRLPLKGTLSGRDALLAAVAFAGSAVAICCFPLLRGS